MNNVTIYNGLTLESAQQRFESWRRGWAKREPIPEFLWQAAVELCKRYSLTQVSHHLQLSYTDLKQRLKENNFSQIRFMELDLSCAPAPGRLSWSVAMG